MSRAGAALRALLSAMPSGRFATGGAAALGTVAALAYGVNASLYNGTCGWARLWWSVRYS
jgi:hypothetical protein